MQSYDPMIALDPRQWNLLDEYERVALVVKYHQEAGIELPDENAHALLHVVIENQIAQGDELPVEAVLHRLTDDNLDRHDPVHAIASILTNHIFELMHGEDAALGNDEYFAKLGELTAEKWQRGDYTGG